MQNLKMDFHVHSDFSPDSHVPMSEMIKEAINRGVTDIAFTEHIDFDSDQSSNVKVWDFDKNSYFESIATLQNKYPNIKLYKAAEIGLQEHIADKNKAVTNEFNFDFIIGSLHMLDKEDLYYTNLFTKVPVKEAIYRYYESFYENTLAFSNMNVLGHLDLYTRYSKDSKNVPFNSYSDVLETLLTSIIQKGIGIEVNAGGHRYGLGCNNPTDNILKLYRHLGGEIITLGSDAHSPVTIAAAYEENCEKLKTLGFKYITLFESQKPIFKALD